MTPLRFSRHIKARPLFFFFACPLKLSSNVRLFFCGLARHPWTSRRQLGGEPFHLLEFLLEMSADYRRNDGASTYKRLLVPWWRQLMIFWCFGTPFTLRLLRASPFLSRRYVSAVVTSSSSMAALAQKQRLAAVGR